MKKLLFLAILLAPLVTNAAFNTNLSYGQKGSDIYQLQDVLIKQKFLNHSATGYFGMLTLDAVKAYQTANGIPSTGFVGLLTRTSLNKIVETNTASSIEAEKEETGTVAIPTVDDLATVCPAGFDCTPTLGSSVAQPEPENSAHGAFSIVSGGNTFQFGLDVFGPMSTDIDIVSYPENLEIVKVENHCLTVGTFPCNITKFLALKNDPAERGHSPLPNGNYSFTVKVFGKEYNVTMKNGENMEVFNL